MTPYYSDDLVTLYHGDCLDVLADLPDASVDAVVTDPPYGLANTSPAQVAETVTRWTNGERDYLPGGRGFMGKAWDAFVPPVAVWDECLRVLKPGGHAVVFAGSRTVDLMGLAVRLAGFDIRDQLQWLYGSGFPKSLNVSKAIDKTGGVSPADSARVLLRARERSGLSREAVAARVGCTPSSIRDWEQGRARSAGKAVEFITPSPQYRDRLAELLGYTTDERRIVGATTKRIGYGDGIGVYALGHSGNVYSSAQTTHAKQWEGWGTALKPAHEPIVLARKPIAGTVAANVLEHGTGALNIDACRVGDKMMPRSESDGTFASGNSSMSGHNTGRPPAGVVAGRWPPNIVLDEAAAAHLDEQTGTLTSGKAASGGHLRNAPDKSEGIYGGGRGLWSKEQAGGVLYGDTGGASRFLYTAKADAGERPAVDGIQHPTVKPVDLMRWLVRLVTPPGGVVLDPFAGSGSTVEACILERFRSIGVEREADYLPLVKARIYRQRNPVEAIRLTGDELGLFGLGETS